MKLKYILLTILLFSAVVVKSQVVWILIFGDKLSNDKIQSGINVSLASVSYIGLEGAGNQPTWALGGFTEVLINDHWSFQPEFVFKSPSGASNLNDYYHHDLYPDTILIKDKVYHENTSFALPLIMKYKTKYFGLGIGPQLSYTYSSKIVYKGSTDEIDDITIKDSYLSKINRFDVGIMGLLEFYLKPAKKATSMRIGLKYYYGFTSPLKDYPDAHNSVFMLSFGIPIVAKSNISELE